MMELLKKIGAVQSYSDKEWRMFAFIVRYIRTNHPDVGISQDFIGNLYITKGDAENYPCVVAHMDSVFEIESDLSVLEVGGNLFGMNKHTMQQRGVGWDDGVGIWVALKCLDEFENIKLAFFVCEEMGCCGSREAEMDFFLDCGYILQCDRQGNEDFVTKACGVKLSSKRFIKEVSQHMLNHGYITCDYGGLTDVVELKERGVGISCANISCGYYNPHMEDEYVNIVDVKNTLDLVVSIIEGLGEKRYAHAHIERQYDKIVPYGRSWEEPSYQNYCRECFTPVYDIKEEFCKHCKDELTLFYGTKSI